MVKYTEKLLEKGVERKRLAQQAGGPGAALWRVT